MPWSVYDALKDQINFGYKTLTGIVKEDLTVEQVLNLEGYKPLKSGEKRPYEIIRDT